MIYLIASVSVSRNCEIKPTIKNRQKNSVVGQIAQKFVISKLIRNKSDEENFCFFTKRSSLVNVSTNKPVADVKLIL